MPYQDVNGILLNTMKKVESSEYTLYDLYVLLLMLCFYVSLLSRHGPLSCIHFHEGVQVKLKLRYGILGLGCDLHRQKLDDGVCKII